MNKRLFLAAASLIMVVAALVSGCRSAARVEPERIQDVQWSGEVAEFTAGLQRYVEVTGHPPASKEELQDFCSRSNLPCETLDWSKFSWVSVDDKNIKVIYTSDTFSLPIVAGQGAPPIDEVDTIDDSLKE